MTQAGPDKRELTSLDKRLAGTSRITPSTGRSHEAQSRRTALLSNDLKKSSDQLNPKKRKLAWFTTDKYVCQVATKPLKRKM